jgi:hypothetical protein
MDAFANMASALAVDSEAAEAPTFLDALARAPAAAAAVVRALTEAGDRKALRLAHSQLRDAVGAATTTLEMIVREGAAAPRPPMPRRWPRLEELTLRRPDSAALEALGAETWHRLRVLTIGDERLIMHNALDAPSARALAAALRRMPALRALELLSGRLSGSAAAELLRLSSAADVPQLRSLGISNGDLVPTTLRALVATEWRLEALDLSFNENVRAAGLAALLAATTLALGQLTPAFCGLNAASLLGLANAPWPLEELNIAYNDFSATAAGPALVALARRRHLRRLNLGCCKLSAASFKALVVVAWPALTYLNAGLAAVESDGPHALGPAAFAGFPALEELELSYVELGEAGARLLASWRWARLKRLVLAGAGLSEAGVAALARGVWPALEQLNLRDAGLSAVLALADARRWAPALLELLQ